LSDGGDIQNRGAVTVSERILIVEDDPSMRHLIRSQLEVQGFSVQVAADGHEALRLAANGPLDLVLLDITLPTIDGLEVARRLRSTSSIPIILVTARDSPETKIAALDIGGDDYLTKPFHSGELTARVRAVLRRANKSSAPAIVQAGNLTILIDRRIVMYGDEEIRLTKLEFGLLQELACRPDTVVTYEQLMRAVWGSTTSDMRAVHVHICNLRRKIEHGRSVPRMILPVAGIGYRFRMPAAD
jgi:DNA-binding response OmpR family regulator